MYRSAAIVCIAFSGLAAAVAPAAGQCVSWHEVSSFITPPGRQYHHMVYDTNRNVIIMLGGETAPGVWTKQTWELSGSTWTMRPDSPMSFNVFASAAFDAARNRVVVIGPDPVSGEQRVCEFDPASGQWTQPEAIGSGPGPHARLAYDAARSEIIAVGGDLPGTFRYLGAGSGWEQVGAGGPELRRYHSIAYDEARARIVVFGGKIVAGGLNLQDLWEWNGSVWQQIPTGPVNPPALAASAHTWLNSMCYDPGSQRMYLVDALNQQVWQLDNGVWSILGPALNISKRPIIFDAAGARLVGFGGLHPGVSSFSSRLDAGTLGRPGIIVQPQSIRTQAGMPATLAVQASGEVVSYQWYRNSQPILGATSAVLHIPAAGAGDAGLYQVFIEGPCAGRTSGLAKLTVDCYANCDASTALPQLNVADFSCFLQKFAAGCP